MRVLVHAVEFLGAFLHLGFFLLLVLLDREQARESGARRVDEHQIARIEQAVIVFDESVRRRRRVLIVQRNHAFGPERAHVQPDGRRARAAVVQERQRSMRAVGVALEVRDIEHARGRIFLVLVLAGENDRACDGLVVDLAPFNADAALGRDFTRLGRGAVRGLFLLLVLVVRLVRPDRRAEDAAHAEQRETCEVTHR
jgi:hypothetical protein